MRAAGFKAQAHRQSLAVATSLKENEDQSFIDEVSDLRMDEDLEGSVAMSGRLPAATATQESPRPVVIVQDNSFDSTASITVCAFTTDETDAPLIRLLIEPNVHNGLRLASRLMVDKITTVPKSKLGKRIGRLDDPDMLRLNQAILVFLGLTVSPRVNPTA